VSSKPVHIFSDFDGTITNKDTLVFLSTHLGGGPEMVEAIGRLIREGKITLRDGIAAEMRSIRAPFDEAVRLLLEQVEIDPEFPGFAKWCRDRVIPLTILSAGFEEIIDLFIKPADFPGVEIRANRLKADEKKGWQCEFRDSGPFGHDKAEVIRSARSRGENVIFIGDGLSDRAPAEVADEVFAKHTLFEHCRSQGIICREYQSFADVLREIPGLVSEVR
jgi:2-hydroxy-3-keto-5-methylthiopentenyl-1-phosphate phosphatase